MELARSAGAGLRRLVGPSSYVLVTFAGVGAGLVGSVCVVRVLGSQGRGILAAVMVAATYLSLLTGLGVPLGIRRSAAAEHADIAGLAGVARTMGRYATVASVVAGVPLALLIGRGLQPVTQLAMVGVFLMCGCAVVGTSNTQILAAQGRHHELGVVRTVPAVVVAVGTGLMAIAGLLPLALAVGLLALRPFLEVVLSARKLPRPVKGLEVRPFVGEGIWLLPVQLAESSVGRLDQLLLLPLVGASSLGLYAVLVSAMTLPLAVTQAAINSWFGQSVRGAVLSWSELVRRVALTMGATAACVVPTAVAAVVLLPVLFGPDFRNCAASISVLGLGTVVLAGCFASNYLLLARGSMRMTLIPWLSGTVVTVVSLPVMAPRFGILGASWVSVASYLVVLILMVLLLRSAVGRVAEPEFE